MPKLPAPVAGIPESLRSLLAQWKDLLDSHLPNDAEPLLKPRNLRCSTPANSTIRVKWDPGSLSSEAYDLVYSEHPDFAVAQSHRISAQRTPYFDLSVNDTKRRYFKARSIRGSKISDWSNLASCVATIAAATGGTPSGNPGTVSFDPAVGAYALMSFKNFGLTGKADLIHVVIWYVDEPETQYLYGILTDALNDTDNTPTVGVTVFSRAVPGGIAPTFTGGDLLLVDDPDQDPNNTDFRKYEIMTINTITGSQPGAVSVLMASRGNLGSAKSAHESGRRVYRVKMAHFAVPTKDNAGNDAIKFEESFPLPSACVVAMGLAASDVGVIGSYNVKNCSRLAYPFPGTLVQRNPAPGFRTCTGSEFALPLIGSLIAAQSSPLRLVVNENASFRNAIGMMFTAPQGTIGVYEGILRTEVDKALIVYVLLIEPPRDGQTNGSRRVAVLEQLSIANGDFATFPINDVPDFRRMPYGNLWPFLCPVVGTLDSLFDPSVGQFRANALPFTATGEVLQLEEYSEVDAIVARAGSTVPGASLTVTVLT